MTTYCDDMYAEMEVVKRAAALTRMDMEMEVASSTRDMDPSTTRSETPDNGCCLCFCQAFSCCTRPLAQGLLALLHTEVEALVKHKVQERLAALSASTMARSASEMQGQTPTPPSHDTISTPASHFTIPKGTAFAHKSKAAFKIQHAFRVSRASLARHVCMTIKELPEADKAAAKSFNATLDSIRMVVMASALGATGYRRAVCNTPEWWEEEELVSALRDVMSAPERSPFLFLFARPTRAEHALLSLASDVARRDLEE